jgi:hypothetical protein
VFISVSLLLFSISEAVSRSFVRASNVGAQVANQTSVTSGSATVAVSNYAVPKLPETLSSCGESQTIMNFELQAGGIKGVAYPW